jgi:hypothetical protein
MSSCFIASTWSIINRSLHRSRFKVASDRFSICIIGGCIHYNHCLIFYFFLNLHGPDDNYDCLGAFTFNASKLNWGFTRCGSSFWTWTTTQMRHLTEIDRDRLRWLIRQSNFQAVSFFLKKKLEHRNQYLIPKQ